MKRFALIGKRLGHSWSQQWFSELFARLGLDDHSYTLHEMASLDGLREWVEDEHINGFNVTIPYKQTIIPLLDELSPEAEAIGAVNCVCVRDDRLVGHNTDAPAFRETLCDCGVQNVEFAIILGTGGAAHAVGYALDQLGIEHIFVSRNQLPSFHLSHPDFQLLINATPVGMWPNVDACPLSYDFDFSNYNIKLVYDLIYNPSPTLLLQRAAQAGVKCQDGLAMLHRQAELSWKLWQ